MFDCSIRVASSGLTDSLFDFSHITSRAALSRVSPGHALKPQRLLQSRHERIGKRGGRKGNRQIGGETSIAKGATRYGTSQMIGQLPHSQTEKNNLETLSLICVNYPTGISVCQAVSR
jgi:hypothetical protein